MTTQAENSLSMYRNGNPSTIMQLLKVQKQSVVDELKTYFGVSTIQELASRLSIGK